MEPSVRRLLICVFVSALTLTGCGGGSSSDASSASASAGALGDIKVSGDFGKLPTVEGVKGYQTTKVEATTVSDGDGATLADGDTVNVSYALYDTTTGKSVNDTYSSGAPLALTIDEANDKLLSASIVDKAVGSRLLIAAPASEFYGDQATASGVDPKDTLVLVTDLVSVFTAPKATGTISDVTVTGVPGKAPTIKAKPNLYVTKTQSKVLRAGKGVTLKAGASVKVNYAGVDGRTGETFDSSFERGQPATFTLDTQVIKGFSQGLVGKKVGSRVLVTIPYTAGYGAEGSPPSIQGGDTLIFVIDIISTGKAAAGN